MIEVRPGREHDAAHVADIFNGTIGSVANCVTEPTTAAHWQAVIRSATHPFGFWVAPSPNEGLRGWAHVKPWSFRPDLHGTAELALYVAESDRSGTTAAALLVTALVKTHEAGIQRLIAVVVGGNHASLRGLTAVGFTLSARLEGVVTIAGDRHDICWLALDLADGVPARVVRYAERRGLVGASR